MKGCNISVVKNVAHEQIEPAENLSTTVLQERNVITTFGMRLPMHKPNDLPFSSYAFEDLYSTVFGEYLTTLRGKVTTFTPYSVYRLPQALQNAENINANHWIINKTTRLSQISAATPRLAEGKVSSLDRFIPSRRLIDFDRAYDAMMEERPDPEMGIVMNASELSRNQRQQELLRELTKLARISGRIFRISPFTANVAASPPSMIPLWPCRPRKRPTIRDERVLDLPESNTGYYLNPIDWGSNDWLATSVNNKVLIGRNLDRERVATETVFEYENDQATAVGWSPDGRNLFFGSETGYIHVWHEPKGNFLLEDICCFQTTCRITTVHWHPDSKIFAWGCSRGRLVIRSIVDCDAVVSIPKAHRGGILSVKYSPGGNYICSSGLDGFLRVWKGNGYDAYMQIEMGNPSMAIAWHPWRRGLLAVGEGPPAPGSLSLWNVNTAKLLFLRKMPQSAAITALTFNNVTGELVFAQSLEGDGTSDVFVLGGPNYVSDSVTGLYGTVSALVWNADGTKLGAASSDETLRIWNFLKPKNRKRSFSQIGEDLTFLALKKFRCLIR